MFHTRNNTIVRFHTNSHQWAYPGGGLLGLNPHMEKRAGVECPPPFKINDHHSKSISLTSGKYWKTVILLK